MEDEGQRSEVSPATNTGESTEGTPAGLESAEDVATNGVTQDTDGYAAKDSRWLELEGKTVDEAVAFFKEKYPKMKLLILDEGCKFDSRIVFYQDWDDKVVSVPEVG